MFSSVKKSELTSSKHENVKNIGYKRPNLPPLYFKEVISEPYREDFRRFLLKNRSLAPLQFLEMVSEMKNISDKKFKNYKVNQIWKKFFRNQNAKMLQCSAKIIDLLSSTDYVTPQFLSAAYPAVCESLEENWFKKYERSFYPKPNSETVMKKTVMKKQRFELIWNKEKAQEKINFTCDIIRKIFYLFTEFRLYDLFLTLSTYIECLYQEQILDIDEIQEEKMNRKKLSHFKPRLIHLKLSEYRILIARTKFLEESISYKKLFQSLKKRRRLLVEKHLLRKKARCIINEFLLTEELQYSCLNISPSLVSDTLMKFKREGISHGLFHDIALFVLPSIYKVWDIMHIEQNVSGGRRRFRHKLKTRLKVIKFNNSTQNIFIKKEIPSFIEENGHNAWSVSFGMFKNSMNYDDMNDYDKHNPHRRAALSTVTFT